MNLRFLGDMNIYPNNIHNKYQVIPNNISYISEGAKLANNPLSQHVYGLKFQTEVNSKSNKSAQSTIVLNLHTNFIG